MRSANRIGRITPSGDITEFAIPTPNSLPNEISRGPDLDSVLACRRLREI